RNQIDFLTRERIYSLIDLQEAPRRGHVQLGPVPRLGALIAQRDRNIADRRVPAGMAEVQYSAQAVSREDEVGPTQIAVDGKARERAIARAAELLQNSDALLHMRAEKPMVLVRVVDELELPAPEGLQEPRMLQRVGILVHARQRKPSRGHMRERHGALQLLDNRLPRRSCVGTFDIVVQ